MFAAVWCLRQWDVPNVDKSPVKQKPKTNSLSPQQKIPKTPKNNNKKLQMKFRIGRKSSKLEYQWEVTVWAIYLANVLSCALICSLRAKEMKFHYERFIHNGLLINYISWFCCFITLLRKKPLFLKSKDLVITVFHS